MLGLSFKGQHSLGGTPTPAEFFARRSGPRQSCHEVLCAFRLRDLSEAVVVERIGYSRAAVNSISREFGKVADPASYAFCPPDPPNLHTGPSGQRLHPANQARTDERDVSTSGITRPSSAVVQLRGRLGFA